MTIRTFLDFLWFQVCVSQSFSASWVRRPSAASVVTITFRRSKKQAWRLDVHAHTGLYNLHLCLKTKCHNESRTHENQVPRCEHIVVSASLSSGAPNLCDHTGCVVRFSPSSWGRWRLEGARWLYNAAGLPSVYESFSSCCPCGTTDGDHPASDERGEPDFSGQDRGICLLGKPCLICPFPNSMRITSKT